MQSRALGIARKHPPLSQQMETLAVRKRCRDWRVCWLDKLPVNFSRSTIRQGMFNPVGRTLMSMKMTRSPLTLLTIQQVAETLKISSKTVRKLIGTKALPVIRLGRSLRVDLEDLERYIASRRFA